MTVEIVYWNSKTEHELIAVWKLLPGSLEIKRDLGRNNNETNRVFYYVRDDNNTKLLYTYGGKRSVL